MSREADPTQRFEALVDGLYDAAVDARDWRDLAGTLAQGFGASSAVLKIQGEHGIELLRSTDNLVVAPQDGAWAEHWHRNDLWVERSLALGAAGIVTSEQLVPQREFERSGYYQDWNRRLGIFHMIGTVFPLDAGRSGVVGIHRPRDAAAFDAPERHRLAALLPHLRRALRLHAQLATTRLREQAGLASLERLHVAAMVVDGQGRLLQANRRAEAALRGRLGLSLRTGRVATDDPSLAPRWRRLLAPTPPRRARALALPAADGGVPVTLLATPLRTPWSPEDAVLLLIRDPRAESPAGAVLRELFGLTATEAAVAVAYADGLSSDEVVARLGIGRGTVRSHLKQVFAKTGTHRQAQLVALIARSVAMFGDALGGLD